MTERDKKISSFSIRTQYDPVGFCIYCGFTENLTDEHTLASGMGGRHVLPKSSCIPCRDIIAPVERYCMRTLMHNARRFFGIRSHRKRPPEPSTIQIRKKSGEIADVTGDPHELPFMIVLPVFPNPTILSGKPTPTSFMGANWHRQATNMMEFLEAHDAEYVMSKSIEPKKLARMIAKTAHAHTTAILGPGSFKPLLTDLILGEPGEYFIELVGGEIAPDEGRWEFVRPTPETLNLYIVFDWFRETDGKCFYVAAIRFFANLGAPTYFAVVGEPIPPRPPWRIKPEIAARLEPPHTIFAPRVAALPKKRP